MATHHRPTNHSKRPLPAHARPSKPAPLSKRTHSHGASKKVAHRKEEESEDEEVMATSFLQYCTTCEKQIVVPSNSVLYCSESCRKTDNEKQLTYTADHSPPLTPFTNFSFEDLHFRDIVQPRSPTVPSKRSSCAFSELSSDDNATSDSEKPRMESDASRYLRQFQSATYNSAAEAPSSVRHARPRFNRASTSNATFSVSAAPSLSHSHASSISFSLPYTPSTRPLPPRTNPHSSSYGARSIDLVTPFTYATAPSSPPMGSLKSMPISTTIKGTAGGEISYQKSPIPSVSSANGSLRQLFASPQWA